MFHFPCTLNVTRRFPWCIAKVSAEMFETMAKQPNIPDLPSGSVDEETCFVSVGEDEKPTCLLVSTENDTRTFDANNVFTFQRDDSNACGRSVEIEEEPSLPALKPSLKVRQATEKNHSTDGHGLNSKHVTVNDSENKENTVVLTASTTTGR